MRVPRPLRELARARDQLEAERWGLWEADGCVGFGSQKLCKTCLAGLSGLASQWPEPLGLCPLPGLRCLCMALCIFPEVLKANWHLGPSSDDSPVRTSLPPASGLTSPCLPLSQLLVLLFCHNPRAFVPAGLSAKYHSFTCCLSLGLSMSRSVIPFLSLLSEILILGPTTLLTVWLTCSMSPEDLMCPLTPAEPHESCGPWIGLEQWLYYNRYSRNAHGREKWR